MRDAEGLCTRLPLCCGFVCPVAVLRQGIFAPYGRKNHMQTVEIADAAAFERTLRRLAHQILENNPEPEQVLLVGILRRGVPLAEELAGLMERFGGVRPPVEMLDITLYRDDLSELGDLPEVRPTQFSTPVAGKTVILVDDVIYTGRTARAAMEAVTHPAGRDGRPRAPRAAHRPGVRRQERADGAGGADLRADAAVRRTMGHSPAQAGLNTKPHQQNPKYRTGEPIMNMIFGVKDRPKFGQTILFAIQQLLAIMAATLVVPVITNGATGSTLSPAAALFGAGVGTLVYLLFTKFRSPVFLGSSFAFLGSMAAAFAGGVSMTLGYAGLILGAVFAGFVYVIIAAAVKVAGVKWLDRLMPVVVIGPTVSIIGLSLAGNAVSDLIKGSVVNAEGAAVASPLITVLCGLVALLVTMLCATYGKKMVRLIPFILGILAGYAVAAVFTLIGNATATDALKVLDFSKLSVLWENGVTLKTFVNYELVTKDFVFLKAAKGFAELNWGYVGAIAVAYVPVAFVVFAEHIADHKNISSIIGKDLLKDPGLSRTLLGDGVGSMAGALLGGCPNTTYGESVACVAITRNASVVTILATAILAMLVSFFSPFVAFVNSIPGCVMGGVCIALYGFIAVSGLKMIQQVDLGKDNNLFVVSTILVTGIGGLSLTFGKITITPVAVALILGILANQILKGRSANRD